jgi:hypothetical protein
MLFYAPDRNDPPCAIAKYSWLSRDAETFLRRKNSIPIAINATTLRTPVSIAWSISKERITGLTLYVHNSVSSLEMNSLHGSGLRASGTSFVSFNFSAQERKFSGE